MTSPFVPSTATSPTQRGSVLVTLLIVMLPLLLVVSATITMFTSRNSKLLQSIQQQKALLAASAGLELAAQSAQAGTLISGAAVLNNLGDGLGCSYVATFLGTDGRNNDGDTLTDEADERAFEVIADGTHGRAVKRLSGILVEHGVIPPFQAAILALGTPLITTGGSSKVNGRDTMINGSPGLAINNVDGVATEPPHTIADLSSRYTQGGGSSITGNSGTPDFGVLPAPFNLPGITAVARTRANIVLTPGTYNVNPNLGSALTNNWMITYCPGDLTITSTARGAGVLLVTGNLKLAGGYRWDGLVIVLGQVDLTGSSLINGAVIQGPLGKPIKLGGSSSVRYSKEAVDKIRALLPPNYVLESWREVGR